MGTPGTKPLLEVFWHEDVLLHDTGAGLFEGAASPLLAVQTPHPEGPERILNMKSVLERGPSAQRLGWHAGRHATEAELLLFHTAEYLHDVRDKATRGGRCTATTLLSPRSWPGLLAAAGTTLEAARHVVDDGRTPAFALVRPPGHHAAPAVADGYCFFNHVAIAAHWALSRGIRRVAVVDWDVHHGNGTQQGFYERADVLTISMHMDHGAWGRTHPQTGGVNECGIGAGFGFNLNVPLPMGSTDHAYLLAFDAIVAPRLRGFAPQLLIVASGVDGGQFDPNGRQLLTTRGFHALAAKTRGLADELCEGRLLIVQEGGYNPAHSAFCVLAATEGFAGIEQSLADPLAYMPACESRAAADLGSLLAAIDAVSGGQAPVKILVVGGAGAMASGTIKDLLAARSRHVDSIVATDLDQGRLDTLRREVGDARLHTTVLDVRDAGALRRAIEAADLCINAVPTFAGHQMAIFQACFAARRPYVDYGGMGAFTVRQKQQHAAWQAAGVTAVLGLGSDPGTSNVVCKAVADRLDRIERINLYWAAKKLGPESPVLVPPYNVNTVMAEYANPSMQFLGGKLLQVPPQSGKETLLLPEPFGRTEFMYTQHSEPLTVPFSRGFAEKGIQEFTWKLHLPEREHEAWVALVKAGFGHFDEPIEVGGASVNPGDVLGAVLRRNIDRRAQEIPEAQSFDVTFAIGEGEKDGRRMTVTCAVLGAPDPLYRGYLDPATSMGLSIGVQLLADAPAAPGVWAPEEIYDPEAFLHELERRRYRIVQDFAILRTS